MKIIGGILRFLFGFVLVMLLKDLYDLFIAYRKYRNKLNGRAIKRLRRMRRKAAARIQKRVEQRKYFTGK